MASKAPTTITAGIVVSGRIEGAEDIEIFGAVKGSIHLDGDVFVDEKARVDADLEVNNLVVRGILVGNVTASDAIELAASARVVGDLTAPRVIVQAGALYRGTIDMGDIEGEIPGEGKAKSSRGRSSAPAKPASRSSAPSRPAPARAAARPEPARPAPTPRREAKPEPVSEPPEPEVAAVEDDEIDLPEEAAKKKVAVKKRS